MTHSPDQPRPELSRFSGEFLSGSPASDQPRTRWGAVDAIHDRLTTFIAYYRDMGQDYYEGPLKLDELEALIESNTALRTRLEEAEARERWIPVSERLPEPYQKVLTQLPDGTMILQHYFRYAGVAGHGVLWVVGPLAWRPLPDPYTPSKEQDHE